MLVYGKMDAAGEGGAPAAKFFIVGTLANVSAEAMVATVGRVWACATRPHPGTARDAAAWLRRAATQAAGAQLARS